MGFARAVIGIGFAGLVLSACAALPGGGPAPLDTYRLSAPEPSTDGRRLGRVQLLVAEPSALKALDGQSIVIEPSPGVVQYLGGAQWADRLPRIVQARLVEAFQATNRLGGVGMPGEGLAIDYQAIADIRSFGIALDGEERAFVDIHVRLLDDRNGVVRASRDFSASVPTAGGANDDFIAALDAAFGRISTDIVNWTIASM